MAILDSATTAVISAKNNIFNSGPVAGLKGTTPPFVPQAAGGLQRNNTDIVAATSGANSSTGLTSGQGLPNVLHSYASYNYNISIAALSADAYNGASYIGTGASGLPLILKSGNADPSNRINTVYGKFDFYADNLILESVIGFEKGANTNVTNISFKVVEPYSMGLFMLSLQQAAYEAGHKNWRDAPFLLTVEFLGEDQMGNYVPIGNTRRSIPFKFTNISCSTDQNGSKYDCYGLPYNETAFGQVISTLKTDTVISGKTVQEVLQTGDKSLQKVINQRFKDQKEHKLVEEADEIVILFPQSSGGGGGGGGGSTEESSGATTSSGSSSGGSIESRLKVNRSQTNDTLVQESGECNAIGSAELGFDASRKGDVPIAKDNQIYDSGKGVFVRGNLIIDPKESNFKFRQDTDIINAINQVLLNSKYVEDALKEGNLTSEGHRKWWRVETQVHIRESDANMKITGMKPKVYVYRVVPYNVHASAVSPVNTTDPTIDQLKAQAAKHYKYIYMGANVDVKKFEINYANNFLSILAADGGLNSGDVKVNDQKSSVTEKKEDIQPTPKGGEPPPPSAGVAGSMAAFAATSYKTDRQGGGGLETQATRAARLFHETITEGIDFANLSVEIIGDPYWIVQSGFGCYTCGGSGSINSDGTVNYQDGEVDAVMEFKTPTDFDQTNGVYKFTAPAGTAQFSGVYKITNVTSTFANGQFTQQLSGMRRRGQPSDGNTGSGNFSTDNPANVDATPPKE